jgi:FdhD protein
VTVTVEPHVAWTWIARVTEGSRELDRDEVAVEEPLEIRVDGESLAVAMRTPGEDEELAAGFLAGEGLIGGRDEIASIGPTDELAANVVEVRTRAGLRRDPSGERRFALTSSCGVCGKAALEFVRQESPPRTPAGAPVEPELVLALPEETRRNQSGYARTGGLHATGLFDPRDGRLLALREDVGRHNAVDKLAGAALLGGDLPLSGSILMVSGRAGFEIVQKAAVAGVPVVCAVSAPSSLAVSAGERLGVTVVGFVRGDSFNVYSHSDRIEL